MPSHNTEAALESNVNNVIEGINNLQSLLFAMSLHDIASVQREIENRLNELTARIEKIKQNEYSGVPELPKLEEQWNSLRNTIFVLKSLTNQ